jgi:hypothetical protein
MIRALASALLFAAACGRPEQCHLALGSAPQGGSGFQAMPLDATLVPGAQGGFHVWLGYRIQGAPPGTVTASHVVRRERDGKLLSRGERRLELGPGAADGWWQSDAATPAFLCPTPLGVSVIGETATFEVKLRAGGVDLATDSATARLLCPQDAQADFCTRICQG